MSFILEWESLPSEKHVLYIEMIHLIHQLSILSSYMMRKPTTVYFTYLQESLQQLTLPMWVIFQFELLE
jgi:hypothetical protein